MTPPGLSQDTDWSLLAAAAPSAGLTELEKLQHRRTDFNVASVITLKTSFSSGLRDATADNTSDYLALQFGDSFFFFFLQIYILNLAVEHFGFFVMIVMLSSTLLKISHFPL